MDTKLATKLGGAVDIVDTYLVHQPNWLTTNNIRDREQHKFPVFKSLIMNLAQDQFISLFQCPAFSLLFSSVTVQLFSCVCSSVQFFSCVFPLRAPMSSDSNLGLETVECLSIPRPVHFTPVHPGTIIGSPGCYPGNSLAHTRLQAACTRVQAVCTSVETVCSIVNIVHNVCALFLQYTALCISVHTICKKYPHFQCKAYIIRVLCNEM